MTPQPAQSKPDNPSEGPDDPFGALALAAVSMHSMFTSLQDAGFTEMQALRLLSWLVTDGQRPDPDIPKDLL